MNEQMDGRTNTKEDDMSDENQEHREFKMKAIRPDAPIGIRYHLPRMVAVQSNSSHYGHGFWPLRPVDLVDLTDDIRRWLVERDKTVPVMLEAMPSTRTVLDALRAEKDRLDDARDALQRRQEEEIKEVLDGGPEGFWELGRVRGTATDGNYSKNYSRYFVRELLRLKDDSDLVEIDRIELGWMVHAHIDYSHVIRQAMVDNEPYRQGLLEEAARLSEENRKNALENIATKKKQDDERKENIAELLGWIAETDDRVKMGVDAGYSMEDAMATTLEDAILNLFVDLDVSVADECEEIHEANSPSLEALKTLDLIGKVVSGESGRPDSIHLTLGRIVKCFKTSPVTSLTGEDQEVEQTEYEAIEIMVDVSPRIYEETLLVLIGGNHGGEA